MARRASILVADDEEMVRSILKLMLAPCGYRITEAIDGEDAVLRYAEAPEPFDLVLLDMQMPRLDGPHALERMRQIHPHLKAILLSGAVAEPALEEGSDVVRHLQKPFDNTELIGLVQEMLGQGSAAQA